VRWHGPGPASSTLGRPGATGECRFQCIAGGGDVVTADHYPLADSNRFHALSRDFALRSTGKNIDPFFLSVLLCITLISTSNIRAYVCLAAQYFSSIFRESYIMLVTVVLKILRCLAQTNIVVL
jgi:hypothetical protein